MRHGADILSLSLSLPLTPRQEKAGVDMSMVSMNSWLDMSAVSGPIRDSGRRVHQPDVQVHAPRRPNGAMGPEG